MKNILIILFIFLFFSTPPLISGLTYDLSYKITGRAKGYVLLIFPYRVFYTAEASLRFYTFPGNKKNTLFKLAGVGKTGYMMRTLGFSGRSLGVLTADNNKSKGEICHTKLIDKFPKIAPEYSKYIKRDFWNNFRFKKIRDTISFYRTETGKNINLKYGLWLKRSPGEKPLRINFNIYRILGEIIKAYNHSFLPKNSSISSLSKKPVMRWESEDIDFSETLARSASYAASIFRRISPIKQNQTFRINYSSSISDKSFLVIYGIAEPDVSIWGSFKIRKFVREVRIRLKDLVLISDSMLIKVSNNTGKGGQFKTDFILVK